MRTEGERPYRVVGTIVQRRVLGKALSFATVQESDGNLVDVVFAADSFRSVGDSGAAEAGEPLAFPARKSLLKVGRYVCVHLSPSHLGEARGHSHSNRAVAAATQSVDSEVDGRSRDSRHPVLCWYDLSPGNAGASEPIRGAGERFGARDTVAVHCTELFAARHAASHQAREAVAARAVPLCRAWLLSTLPENAPGSIVGHDGRCGCTDKRCQFRHAFVDATEKSRVADAFLRRATLEQQKSDAKAQPRESDKCDVHAGESWALKSARVEIFCQWLIDTFGRSLLEADGGVLDIAGGKGSLAFKLQVSQSCAAECNERKENCPHTHGRACAHCQKSTIATYMLA